MGWLSFIPASYGGVATHRNALAVAHASTDTRIYSDARSDSGCDSGCNSGYDRRSAHGDTGCSYGFAGFNGDAVTYADTER